MRGDVTRQTFRSANHYRGVRQQQGRVQLDADWNEQIDIQAYLDRTVTADLIGASGGPRGANAGMAIITAAGRKPENVADDDLYLSAGHYYVDGILCENDDRVPLVAQPDRPGNVLDGKDPGTYIAYLDVWFEHVTRLEQPLLQEVALGGPDTTTRARTIWQVHLRKDSDRDPGEAETAKARKAQMRARAVAPTSDAPTPCVIGPATGYRRLENQLYRVEVFDPTPPPAAPSSAPAKAAAKASGVPPTEVPGGPTFLWSRENSSVIAALTGFSDSALTIAAPGRDTRLGFEKDDWVEVTDRARTRRGERGFLAQLDVVDGTVLPVAAWYPAGQQPDRDRDLKPEDHPIVRRWDGKVPPQPLFPGPAEPADPNGIRLEDGIHIEFDPDGVYRSGDYWLIPARTANLEGGSGDTDLAGTIEWPPETFQPPAGVDHHYADIAQLTLAGGGWSAEDLRPIFDPLTERLDVTVAGGDGQESLPGRWLDKPLQVAVTRGLSPVKGAKVQFTTAGKGTLSAADPGGPAGPNPVADNADAQTDDRGVAQCWWQLDGDPAHPSQQITARLLDPYASGAGPTGPVLGFTASLSLADRVAFDPPGTCTAMAGATTVQSALVRLADMPVLLPIAGNGQIAAADATLPTLVAVLVRSCGAPVPNGIVRFAISEGQVAADGGTPTAPLVDLPTDAEGVARCRWQLGRELSLQTLTATLLDGPDHPDPRAVPLTFVAGVVPKVLAVTRVELPPDTALVDGAVVAATDVKGGAVVILDAAPSPAVANSPALTVTLDLPFPFSQSDRDLWSTTILGTLPLGLDGTVAVTAVGGAPAVGWSPSTGAQAFLDALFAKMRDVQLGQDRVRGHVRLAGSVLGPGAVDHTRWFWLVEKVTHLVLVPHRDGRLRLPSAQRAIALSVSRDALRAGLPSGITIEDIAADLEEARRLARRIFNAGAPPRPLRLVVHERYAAAGVAVKDGLAAVNVDMELIDDADPAAKATALLAGNEIVDGVLTDEASTAALAKPAGFTKPVRL